MQKYISIVDQLLFAVFLVLKLDSIGASWWSYWLACYWLIFFGNVWYVWFVVACLTKVPEKRFKWYSTVLFYHVGKQRCLLWSMWRNLPHSLAMNDCTPCQCAILQQTLTSQLCQSWDLSKYFIWWNLFMLILNKLYLKIQVCDALVNFAAT